jgi:hypothetical protein
VPPAAILGVPWAVVASSFVINWAVWSVADLRHQAGEDGFTGGILALYVTVALLFVQAVTQLLPFAMGVSLSRRSYWLGTALVGILSSVGYGLVLAVLSGIESATDGWGVGLKFWAPVPLRVGNFFLQILVSGAPMLAFVFAGIGIGVVFKRWGPNGPLDPVPPGHAAPRRPRSPDHLAARVARRRPMAGRSVPGHPRHRSARCYRGGSRRPLLPGHQARRSLILRPVAGSLQRGPAVGVSRHPPICVPPWITSTQDPRRARRKASLTDR